MNHRAVLLFLSWANLDPSERAEFDDALRSFQALQLDEQQKRLEEYGNILGAIDLGPLKKPCPQCGR
jgi:hypothetical protein